MGKPSDDFPTPHSPSTSPASRLIEPSAAISLLAPDRDAAAAAAASSSSTSPVPPYYDPTADDDSSHANDDELPPLYSDIDRDAVAGVVDPLLPQGGDDSIPVITGDPDTHILPGFRSVEPFSRDSKSGTVYYLDERLETNPKSLAMWLKLLANLPPRPFVHIHGSHSELRRSGDRDETVKVVDFDIEVELTHLLYSDINRRQAIRELRTVDNRDWARRGTIFPKRAPGVGSSNGVHADEDGVPSMDEWCHRFCASRAGLKNMVFQRRVSGWDWDLLRNRLENLVRDANYRGNITIDFPVRNSRVEIYNVCRTNRWRLTRWICLLFYVSLLFIFTWPWLFFRTRRWETVYAEWHFSQEVENSETGEMETRYSAMSEDRWYNMWARVIQRAVLERRQGHLDQGDLERFGQPPPQRVEGFFGAMQDGVEAMGVVDRSFGWGGDTTGTGFRIGGFQFFNRGG